MAHWTQWVPLVMAVYPVLLFASTNDLAEVAPREVLVLAALSVALTVVILAVSVAVLRDVRKAVTITSLFVIVFFSYGYLMDAVSGFAVGGFTVGRQRYVLPLVVGVTIALGVITLRHKGDLSRLFLAIGAATLILTAFNLTRMTVGWSGAPGSDSEALLATARALPVETRDSSELPDVYWFIFDSYGREDVLRELYGFDNAPFLDKLRSQGFYVADSSRSNYVVTDNSIPATLSMNHISSLSSVDRGSVKAWRSTRGWGLDRSTLGATASDLGYDLHSFAWKPSSVWTSSDFTTTFLDSTLLLVVNTGPLYQWLTRNWTSVFVGNLESVVDLASDPRPTFTFSYNYPPHPSSQVRVDSEIRDDLVFSFDPTTGPQASAHSRMLWIERVAYVNTLILDVIERIIDDSDELPIVVIQSDHGPFSEQDTPGGSLDHPPSDRALFERSSILNAILVPEYCREALYPTVTPINTFRLIFDSCIGTNVGLVDDTTYWGEEMLFKVAPEEPQ